MRAIRSILLLALLGTASAVPALAQPSAPPAALTTYPACSGKPTQAETEAAHGAYMAGKGSFDEADYTTALNYFRDAYRRDCTKHELLIIIARAFELKGDKREAVHALETYLERVPNAQDADVQKRRIANLKQQMTEAPANASATASSTTAPTASSTATAPAATATAAPSASATTPPPPAEPPVHHTLPPWILAGVGAAATLTGAILVPVGLSKVSDAEKLCPNHAQCPNASAVQTGNTGRTLQAVGFASLLGGVALLAGGLTWHFVEHPGPAQTGKTQVTPPVVFPEAGPGYAGVGMSGSF